MSSRNLMRFFGFMVLLVLAIAAGVNAYLAQQSARELAHLAALRHALQQAGGVR